MKSKTNESNFEFYQRAYRDDWNRLGSFWNFLEVKHLLGVVWPQYESKTQPNI